MQNETAIDMVNSIKGDIAALIEENAELRECLREAVDCACARCQVANGINCDIDKPCGKACLPAKWRVALAKASGESDAAK